MRLFRKARTHWAEVMIFPALTVFFLMVAMLSPVEAADGKHNKLWEAITYLKSVPEIAWIEIERDLIILGWDGYPARFSRINRTAAKRASKRVRGKIHVYSVKGDHRGWRPDKNEEGHLCRSTAKGGRLTFSNCR